MEICELLIPTAPVVTTLPVVKRVQRNARQTPPRCRPLDAESSFSSDDRAISELSPRYLHRRPSYRLPNHRSNVQRTFACRIAGYAIRE